MDRLPASFKSRAEHHEEMTLCFVKIRTYQDPQGVVKGHPLTSQRLSIEAPYGVLVHGLLLLCAFVRCT